MARIHAEIDQVELQASQDVQAALARWSDARKWASAYQTDVLPELAKIKDEMEKQFAGKDPALDFGKFLAVERSYLKATENLLDANFELSQAQADLALSVAEPSLAIGPGHLPAQARK